MRKEPRSFYYWLAGGGTLLAIALLTLILIAATTSSTSLAAPATIRGHSHAAQGVIKAGATTTGTVYVPLISYQEALPPSLWQGEYYDNTGLTGNPVYTTEETGIDHDWGDDAPAGLPDNYFSIRWTGTWHFEAGQYTFFAYSDDGMRLWLDDDDDPLIDAWSAGMGDHDATVTIDTAGSHRVKVEYFERTGDAAVRVRWRRTDLYPPWHGDYYDDPWVESGKRYERTDSVIQFDWGEGCPEDLWDCTQFSVGWEATPVFEPGTHRIHFYADEGYQLFVDGTKVGQGGWEDGEGGGGEDDDYDLGVSGTEYHTLTFNFHDRGGPAEARLWIENLAYPEWTAKYYDNMNLSGTPVVTREESAIFYDWGLGKPRPRMPDNRFSVRWSGQRYFHSGFYRFSLFVDDGVRLWIDGKLLVDAWHYGRSQYDSRLTYLDTGYHDVVIEYFENTGEAEVRFWWE